MDPLLLIPLIAVTTGLVAVLKMPREAFLPRRDDKSARQLAALEEEVVQLRQELAETRERLDFTERLLEPATTPQLPAADQPAAG